MLSTEKAQGADIPVSLYVKKIQSVCDMHGVTFGTPEDLPVFLKQLREDRHLAMDFWSLNAALSAKEGEQLSTEQMLDIVVNGVTGKDVTEVRASSSDLSRSIDELKHLLEGVDIDNPLRESDSFGMEPAAEVPVNLVSRTQPADTPKERARTHDTAPQEAVTKHPDPGARHAAGADAEHPSHIESAMTLKQIEESMLLMEQLYRGLMVHVDGIDKRLSRLEQQIPQRTEELGTAAATPKAATAPVPDRAGPQQTATTQTANYNRAGAQSWRRSEPSRLILTEPSPTQRGEDHSLDNMLSGYSGNDSRLGLYVVLPVVLAAAVFFGWRYREPLQQYLNPIISKVQSLASRDSTQPQTQPQTQSQPVPAATAPAAPQTAAPATQNNASQNNATQNNPASSSAPPHVNSQPNPQPAAAAPAASDQATQASTPPQRRGRPSEDDNVVAEPSFTQSPGAVAVPAYIMENNLITSRVPAYPEAARSEGVQGRVLLQASISRLGVVDHLSVLEGNPLLRAAAVDAVSKWRYRPYLVNGRPVDVSTTIRVDFKLPNQ